VGDRHLKIYEPRDNLLPGQSLLAVEPYSAVPNTYTVPFRGGLLIYVVPPGKRLVGMVDIVGVKL
jgi:hypothetical protein